MTVTALDQVLSVIDRSAPAVVEEERRSFAEAMGSQQHRIATLVRRLLGWPACGNDVDDVVQEVFLAAWQHRRQFRAESTWGTWLHRIAVHKTRNHVRARQRRWRLLSFLGLGPGSEPLAPPESNDDTDGEVRRAVASLPHRDREMLVLCYLEQQPVAQVAEYLGIGRVAADTRLSRARRRLRDVLGEDALGEDGRG